MRRVQRHMTEPSADRVDVDSGAQKMDRSRVPDCVRAYAFRRHRRHSPARPLGILRHEPMDSEPRQWLVAPVQEDRIALAPVGDEPRKRRGGDRPQRTSPELFPLPCSRTDDCAPSCRLSMVSLAASSARAPLLYKNRSRAWSRSPRGVRRSGWARRASISAFSRYPIPALAVFLNGVARISAHQATCAGERMPMNRANDRMVASLWLRVTPLHWRSCSRWSRNLRTMDGARSSMVMRSMARPPCLPANGSKSARVSR